MLIQSIALVPEAHDTSFSELTRVCAALQRQVTRDVAPVWGVMATVDAFASIEDVPVGYFPVILTGFDLGKQSGVHLDSAGRPYAQVERRGAWSIAASRACIEMLVNPFANRSLSGQSPRSDQGPVDFLVDPCGPCGDARHAYAVNGVAVADFCTPAFYGEGRAEVMSFTGAVKSQRKPAPGGHLAWYDPVSGSYWLRTHYRENPLDTKLGVRDGEHPSVRELLNTCAPVRERFAGELPETVQRDGMRAEQASHVQAQRWRAQLGKLLSAELLHPMPVTDYYTVELGELTEVVTAPRRIAAASRSFARPVGYVPRAEVHVESLEHEPAFARPARSVPPPIPTPVPSIAPIAVEPTRAEAEPASRPALALLAAAAVVALAWFAFRQESSPDASRHAAAEPPAVHAPIGMAGPALEVDEAEADELDELDVLEPAKAVEPGDDGASETIATPATRPELAAREKNESAPVARKRKRDPKPEAAPAPPEPAPVPPEPEAAAAQGEPVMAITKKQPGPTLAELIEDRQ